MRVVDAHTHVASTRFVAHEFLEGIADNMLAQMQSSPVAIPRARILDQMLRGYQDHDASQQLREMDRSGVEKSILLLPDFTYALKRNELSIAEMYLAHHQIREASRGRFEVFAGPDPRWGRDGFELFVKGVEAYGFRGLKLYPPCGYRPDSAPLTPYYEYCEEYRLPVLVHIGPTSPALSFAEAVPMHVDAPALRYRNIPFILAHGAINYQDECVRLCQYRPNVYLDLSGAQRLASNPQSVNDFIKVLASGINHKVLYGTDWPVNTQAKSNQQMIDLIAHRQTTTPSMFAKDATLILRGNIERILGAIRVQQRGACDGPVSGAPPGAAQADYGSR
jgi:predicted TIM-barrel fold metal-dependent hydrolase